MYAGVVLTVRRCVLVHIFWLGAWEFQYVLCDAPAINGFFLLAISALLFFNRFNSSVHLSPGASLATCTLYSRT